MIKDPLRWLPLFIGVLIEFMVSMRRIEDFLRCDEILTNVVEYLPGESTQSAVEIDNGNFHWGFNEDKKKQEKQNSKVSETSN